MEKKIQVIVKGPGHFLRGHDVLLDDGSTGKNLIKALKLPKIYEIFRPKTASNLDPDENIHELLDEGETIHLVSALEQMGWKKNDYFCWGDYSANNRLIKGLIERRGKRWYYYIKNPPKEILSGKHGNSFTPVGMSWYQVHIPSDDALVENIKCIQKYIDECYRKDS